MTNERAIKLLNDIIKTHLQIIASVDRKKWRESEKAMTIVSYKEEIEALQLAISKLEE